MEAMPPRDVKHVPETSYDKTGGAPKSDISRSLYQCVDGTDDSFAPRS
jgi:hypothetical protein